MSWSYALDTSSPDGATQPGSILQNVAGKTDKKAFIERLDIDHYWPLSGTQVSDANAGKHRKVHFYGVLAVKPSVAAGEVALYIKTVSGKSELFLENEDGTEKQLSTAGKLNIADADLALVTAFTLAVSFPAGLTVGQDTDVGDFNLRAKTLESDVAAGTAPLTVASTTKVTNLNADQLDGHEAEAMLGALETTDSDGNDLAQSNIYKAQCDGEVTWYDILVGGGGYTIGRVGTSNPPDIAVAEAQNYTNFETHDARSFLVPKNHYFKITSDTTVTTIYWRPLASGGAKPAKQP